MSRIRNLVALVLLAVYVVVPMLVIGVGLLLSLSVVSAVPAGSDVVAQAFVGVAAYLALFVLPAGTALVLWTVRPSAARWIATLLGALSIAVATPGLLFASYQSQLALGGLVLVAAAFPLGAVPRKLAR